MDSGVTMMGRDVEASLEENMFMTKSRLYGLLLLIAVLLAACVMYGVKPYPSGWPELAEVSGQCPDLSGTYDNVGTCEKASGSSIADCPSTSSLDGNLLDPFSAGGVSAFATPSVMGFVVELTHPEPNSLNVAIRDRDSKKKLQEQALKLNAAQWKWVGGLAWEKTGIVYDCDNKTLRLTDAGFGTDFTKYSSIKNPAKCCLDS